jgi:adenosine kinase
MKRILVSGSLAYDLIADYPKRFSDAILSEKIHALSVSFEIEKPERSFGGTAGNIAYTLGLLGLAPRILGKTGEDFALYREHLERAGVDLSYTAPSPGEATALAIIMTDRDDNQIAAFYPGASARHSPLPESIWGAESLMIVSPGNAEDMRAIPAHCKKTGTPFIFDPGQQISRMPPEDLSSGIDGSLALFVNDYELELIKQKTGLSEDALFGKTETLITTFGAKGSRIRTKEQTYEIPPATPAEILDPTGAGDAYRAGFIAGLAKGWPLPVVGRFASVIACYTVERRGTQTHSFTWDDLRVRYQANFKEFLPI